MLPWMEWIINIWRHKSNPPTRMRHHTYYWGYVTYGASINHRSIPWNCWILDFLKLSFSRARFIENLCWESGFEFFPRRKTNEMSYSAEESHQRKIMFASRLKINARGFGLCSLQWPSQVTKSHSNDALMCLRFFKCPQQRWWRRSCVYVFCPCRDAWPRNRRMWCIVLIPMLHADMPNTHRSHSETVDKRMIFIVAVCTLLEYSFHGQTMKRIVKRRRPGIGYCIACVFISMCAEGAKMEMETATAAAAQHTHLKRIEKDRLEHEILISGTPQNILAAHVFTFTFLMQTNWSLTRTNISRNAFAFVHCVRVFSCCRDTNTIRVYVTSEADPTTKNIQKTTHPRFFESAPAVCVTVCVRHFHTVFVSLPL